LSVLNDFNSVGFDAGKTVRNVQTEIFKPYRGLKILPKPYMDTASGEVWTLQTVLTSVGFDAGKIAQEA